MSPTKRISTSDGNVSPSKRACARPSTHSMLTRGFTTSVARNAVLDTTELLEKIILELPVQDIMSSVRSVSKHWRQVVQATQSIQRKLFLNPEPYADFWIYDSKTEHLRPYDRTEAYLNGKQWYDRQLYMRPSVLNPLLFKQDNKDSRDELTRRARTCESIRFIGRPDLAKLGKQHCTHHDMFLTQPPVERVEFLFYWQQSKRGPGRKYTRGAKRLKVKRDGGVRFRDVLEEFLKQVGSGTDETPSSKYSIKVDPMAKSEKRSLVWMLGAIFVDEKEIKAVRAQTVKKPKLEAVAFECIKRELYDQEKLRPFFTAVADWAVGHVSRKLRHRLQVAMLVKTARLLRKYARPDDEAECNARLLDMFQPSVELEGMMVRKPTGLSAAELFPGGKSGDEFEGEMETQQGKMNLCVCL